MYFSRLEDSSPTFTALNTVMGRVGYRFWRAQHRVLPDRLHLVLRYSDGRVALWNVAQGRVEADYGEVSFEAKCEEVTEEVSMASWFSVDIRMGSVAVTLEPPTCFSAEMYATELGVEGASDELKVRRRPSTRVWMCALSRRRLLVTRTAACVYCGRIPSQPHAWSSRHIHAARQRLC
jgi:hypothetical protein